MPLPCRRRRIVAVVSCCLAINYSAHAWWETGHQAVARIAAAHLTPAARTRLARILNVPDTPEAVSDALAKVSTWADETKNENGTASWHYIDLTLQDHKSDIPERCKDDNCAPARIRLFAAQLSSRTAGGRWSELDALRFVVHLVADVHQPLHTISDADLGGNCEVLDPQIGKAKNLHGLWDGELVNEMDPNDKTLAESLETDVEGAGNRARELAKGGPEDWVWESHELAVADVYQRLQIPVEPAEFPATCATAPAAITSLKLHPDTAYLNDMKPVVRTQLVKAGLRLARLLNETL